MSVAVVSLIPATAHGSAAKPSVALTGPKTVVEGTNYKLIAKIAKPRSASRVTLESHSVSQYGLENDAWQKVSSTKVRGRSKITFELKAGTDREDYYRVAVSYVGIKGVKAAVSKPARVDLMHWFDGLGGAYYEAGEGTDVVGFQMAGRAWRGWHMYGGTSATSDYTLIADCTEFKATVGLTDDSDDNGTGTLTLSVINPHDAVTTIYTSPTLIPGVTADITLKLAKPYRFGVDALNTSTPVTNGTTTTTPIADPAVGNPRFLCHQD